MSRIGKQPIEIPAGVEVRIAEGVVAVKGPKGELTQRVSTELQIEQGVEQGGSTLSVERPSDDPRHRALHGLTRSLIANMVDGVTTGFHKELEIQGVGYRAQLKGSSLELALGFSHAVKVEAPKGIEFEVPQPTQILVRGIDKQAVGEAAARIRKLRPPEPYKGKGIRYAGEHVRRKVGKRA
jgi:large subunit ribosomal protein L6